MTKSSELFFYTVAAARAEVARLIIIRRANGSREGISNPWFCDRRRKWVVTIIPR